MHYAIAEGSLYKWSGIKSIDSIGKATHLKYLHIGSSPSLAPLEPLEQLSNLEWLELENIKACSDLSFAKRLKKLKGFLLRVTEIALNTCTSKRWSR
ncbi:MAG: hypothetical protein R3F47_18615 [Gammaproteobacteria bacterium]